MMMYGKPSLDREPKLIKRNESDDILIVVLRSKTANHEYRSGLVSKEL